MNFGQKLSTGTGKLFSWLPTSSSDTKLAACDGFDLIFTKARQLITVSSKQVDNWSSWMQFQFPPWDWIYKQWNILIKSNIAMYSSSLIRYKKNDKKYLWNTKNTFPIKHVINYQRAISSGSISLKYITVEK